MTTMQIAITVLIIGVGIMTTRFLPFILFPDISKTPDIVIYLGKVLPYAAMSMLVVFCLKNVAPLAYPHALPELFGVVVVALLHIWRGSMFLSIGVGTVFYMFLVQVVFK